MDLTIGSAMRCIANTIDGKPCRGYARKGSEFCFFHDQVSCKQRHEAQRKGGSNRSRLEDLPKPPHEFDLADPDQIGDLLTFVANLAVSRKLPAKHAYAIGACAARALRINAALEAEQSINSPDAECGDNYHFDDVTVEADLAWFFESSEEAAKDVLAEYDEKRLKEMRDALPRIRHRQESYAASQPENGQRRNEGTSWERIETFLQFVVDDIERRGDLDWTASLEDNLDTRATRS
jgi:hypothetical protein